MSHGHAAGHEMHEFGHGEGNHPPAEVHHVDAAAPKPDKAAVRHEANSVQKAAAALAKQILSGAIPANPFDDAPLQRTSQYASAADVRNLQRKVVYDRIMDGGNYGAMPADAVQAAGGLTPAEAAENAALLAVLAAARTVSAKSLKEMRSQAETARTKAAEAATTAQQVVGANEKAKAAYFASGAVEVAEAAHSFASERIKDEKTWIVFKDVGGRPIVGRVAAAAVTGLAGLISLLIWGLGFSPIRRVYGDFTAKDLDLDGSAMPPELEVDVVAKNGVQLWKAVRLLDAEGKPLKDDAGNHLTSTDNWSVDGAVVKFTKPANFTAKSDSVKYLIEALASPETTTDAATITIKFTNSGSEATTAKDVIFIAQDRTSPAKFEMLATNFQYATDPRPEGWSEVKDSLVTYTPPTGLASDTIDARASYKLGTNGTVARLVVLFPAPTLTRNNLPRTGVETFRLDGETLKLSGTNGTEWSDKDGAIQLDLTKVAANVNQTTAKYSIERAVGTDNMDKKLSVAGALTANLLAAGMAPTAQDKTFVTANRKTKITVRIAGAQLNGTPTSNFGTWATEQDGLSFTPNAMLPSGEQVVTAPFQVTSNGLTSTNTATLTIRWLAAPTVSPVNSAERAEVTRQLATTTTLNCQVVLTGTLLIRELAMDVAQWSVDGKTIVLTPLGPPYEATTASIGYKLRSLDDMSETDEATLTLNFKPLSAFPIVWTASRTMLPQINLKFYCKGVGTFSNPQLYASPTSVATKPLTVTKEGDPNATLLVQIRIFGETLDYTGTVADPAPGSYIFYYDAEFNGQRTNRAKITLMLT